MKKLLSIAVLMFLLSATAQAAGTNAKPVKKQSKTSRQSSTVSNLTITVNGVSFVMVGVQGGTFMMGGTPEQGKDVDETNEWPVHQVTLSSFHIGQTEVTQELWQAVMGSNPSVKKGDRKPVESVSWDNCQEFITKLNALTGKRFRLPTEAEWEYAARGGNKSRGYRFAGSDTLNNVSWNDRNSDCTTHEVATKAPNELGLYDMTGNVWEWCNDWSGKYSDSPQTNPTGPATGSSRVFRGGGWYDRSWSCYISKRNYIFPSYSKFHLGLRLAL